MVPDRHGIIFVRMSRLVEKLKFPALLLLIAVAFEWKIALSGQYTCLDGPDNVSQVMPLLQEQTVQWHEYRFPLWDTHLWAGQPLIGQVQPGTLNPLNWLLFSMPLKDGFIQIPVLHWYWVLIQYLAVLFCYWLCRDIGLSNPASVLGGCAFGLGGFVGAIGWTQMMLSALLLPLILMFFLRVLREENVLPNAAASGALLGASFLSGHHNVPIYFTLAVLGLWIYYFSGVQRSFRWKAIAPAAAFTACFALIAAAQILPALELGKLSVRWVSTPNPLAWNQRVPYSAQEDLSVYPTAILGIVIRGFQHNSAVFIGVVAVALGLLGALTKWRDRNVRVLASLAMGGLFFALGAYSLFHGVLYALVPGLDKARSPSMAEAIFHLGIGVLAAYGLDSFRSAQSNEAPHRIAIRLLGFISLFLYAALIVLITVRPEKGEEYRTLAQTALVALIAAGILAWSRSRLSNTAAGVSLILLLLFELNPVTTYGYQRFEAATTLHKLYENHDIAAFLKQKPDLPRADVDEKEISYNFGDWFGTDQLIGIQAGAVKSIADVQGEWRYRVLLAVNYFVGRTPSRPEQTVVFEGQTGVKVFANPGVLPRARIVHAAIGALDEVAVIRAVLDPSTDLARTVIFEGAAPALETCDGGNVYVQSYRANTVVLHSSSPCKSMVVLADTWFPGWKAFVDGRPARIWKAYNLVRGVEVASGQHEVKMVYRPSSVFLGAALAVLGLMISIALQFRRMKT